MEVNILHYTPIEIIDRALTKCWDSDCKTGQDMLNRIDRIGNKYKHQSILEHCSVNFEIKGVSRALLQEMSRHRIASITVKSTRYTLKELKNEEPFFDRNKLEDIIKNRVKNNISIQEPYTEEEYLFQFDFERASKYIVFTENIMVDSLSIVALDGLRNIIQSGVSNDIAKYCLPECYKTEFSSTMNIRTLANFLSLRTDKAALWEIRNLANKMYEVLPEDYKFILRDYVKVYNEENK